MLEIFQIDNTGGGFETFKIILPTGEEFVNQNKNRGMSMEILKPYVGEKAKLHMYHESEFMYTEIVTIEKILENPRGSDVPMFSFDEELTFSMSEDEAKRWIDIFDFEKLIERKGSQ